MLNLSNDSQVSYGDILCEGTITAHLVKSRPLIYRMSKTHVAFCDSNKISKFLVQLYFHMLKTFENYFMTLYFVAYHVFLMTSSMMYDIIDDVIKFAKFSVTYGTEIG